jgi:GGDEF domain-containing protein
MRKFASRIVAVLVIPCLLADLSPAASLYRAQTSHPTSLLATASIFSHQALAEASGFQRQSPILPAIVHAYPVKRGDTTRGDIGDALRREEGDWTLAFIDLDYMRHFNVVLGKNVVDEQYLQRLQALISIYFSDCQWGFDGGDEIFIFVPGDPTAAQARVEELRRMFRNGGISPDRRMTFSAGLLTKKQAPKGLFSEINNDRQIFLAGRELVSRALEMAKVKKDGIALYAPPSRWETMWKSIKSWWFDYNLPLHLSVYESQTMRALVDGNDNDRAISLPCSTQKDQGDWRHIVQYHDLLDFRRSLENDQEKGTPIILGATTALYSGKTLNRAIKKLMSSGREVFGAWAGGKVWNIYDPTYTAFDHIILAIRLAVTEEFAMETAHFPGAWNGATIKLVRGPPDTVFFALIPPATSSPDTLLKGAEAAKNALERALQRAQDKLSPNPRRRGLFRPWQMLRYGTRLSLQAAAVVLAPKQGEKSSLHADGLHNPFNQLEILRVAMAVNVGKDPGQNIPPSKVVLLKADEMPSPEQIALAKALEEKEKARLTGILDSRPINRESHSDAYQHAMQTAA